MKRLLCAALAALLLACLFAACTKENPPTVHVVHGGVLYEVPEETVGIGELDESKLTEAVIIPLNYLPSSEGEVNTTARSAQIYDDGEILLVILDGAQHLIKK